NTRRPAGRLRPARGSGSRPLNARASLARGLRSKSDRFLGHAGIVQLLSSRVGAMISRLWFVAGTGGDVVKISHWFLISAAGRKRIVYISCISWWSQLREEPLRGFRTREF